MIKLGLSLKDTEGEEIDEELPPLDEEVGGEENMDEVD